MIRPLRPEDADELAALYLANRDFLAPFEPARPPEFFTADGQRRRLERQLADATHPFAIVDGEAIAGTINLFRIFRDGPASGVIGYWIDRARNGRGLATGAVGEILAYAFGVLDLHRVEAATLVDNVSSQRVLEKNASSGSGSRGGISASTATGETSSSSSGWRTARTTADRRPPRRRARRGAARE